MRNGKMPKSCTCSWGCENASAMKIAMMAPDAPTTVNFHPAKPGTKVALLFLLDYLPNHQVDTNAIDAFRQNIVRKFAPQSIGIACYQ